MQMFNRLNKKIMSNKLQLRRDTAANWESANPVLAQGEIGLILDDNGKVVGQKIGDGVTVWKELVQQESIVSLKDVPESEWTYQSQRQIDEYGNLIVASGQGTDRVLGFAVSRGDTVFATFTNITAYNKRVVRASLYAHGSSYDNPAIGEVFFHDIPTQNEEINIEYYCNEDGYFYIYAFGLKMDDYIPLSTISIKKGVYQTYSSLLQTNTSRLNVLGSNVKQHSLPSYVGAIISSHQGVSDGTTTKGSYLSWLNASRLGYKWMECDIQFTSDNIPVFVHDEPINVNGAKIVDSNGDDVAYESGGTSNIYIKNLTLEQLKTYRWKDGSPIMTLEEGFGALNQLGMNCRLEFKHGPSTRARLDNLISSCKKFGTERIIYNCTSTDAYQIFPILITSGIFKAGIAAKNLSDESKIEELFSWCSAYEGVGVSIYGQSNYTVNSEFIQLMAERYNVPLDSEIWADFGLIQPKFVVSDDIAPALDRYDNNLDVSSRTVDTDEGEIVGTFSLDEISNVNITAVSDDITVEIIKGSSVVYQCKGCNNGAIVLRPGEYSVRLIGHGKLVSLTVRY